MKLLKQLLTAVAASTFSTTCFGQSSWLDFSNAIPKVSMPTGNAGFNNPSQGFPSTSGYPGANPNTINSAGSSMPGGFGGIGPTLAPAQKDWKLGVFVQNTDVGAVITQVAPGSGGQQAGLQPNDIIVAVGGSRIGSFGNRTVELAEEIRRNTDSMGRVSLLVFNSRQRTIVSLPVSMVSSSSTLAGIASTRDRLQLPSGSMLVVQLQNVSQQFYEIAGGKSVTRAEGFGPFGFELHLDPRYLEPRNQYQLTASITQGNQVLYTLSQPILVDVNNLGQSLNLVLEKGAVGQAYGNSGQPNFSSGNVISAAYAGVGSSDEINALFLQLLGKVPSAKESIAWQSYLQQGNSITDLKIKLMANSGYRARFNNDSAYIQQVIASLANRSATQQEVAYWTTRLQTTGSPEMVIGEILAKNP